MGIVYLAHDMKLGRDVAIKMLHMPRMQRQETLSRFRSEAEILARTVHPNIVQVHDIGEPEGEPFIVMEYCNGGSLSDYLRGVPVGATLAARWMHRIAEGVSAAHAMGVAHRDLKPSNVLLARTHNTVANGGENKVCDLTNVDQLSAKITDFGLAKRLDANANLTATGDTIGTPAYMAPEQLSIREGIDPKLSDVYSLGAILYECLTGRPPIRGSSALETIELLRTQDPVSIRRLQPLVPVDLSVIAHKCLQREPNQRYASVEAFSDDLQRFLEGRPILARPLPVWRKAWRWARRRPAIATSLVTAFAAMVTLLIGWALFTKEIQSAKDTAERERDIAKTQTKRAERNATWAMEAVDKLITQVGDKVLASTPQMDQTRKDLLQTAVAFCLKFAEDRENPDPEARNQVALAYRRLAKIHRALGETKPWLESLETASEIHRQLVSEFPDNDEYLTEFSKTLNNLSNVQGERSGIDQVVATLEEAIAIKMELVLRHPKSAEHRSSLATSLYSIGSKYRVVSPEKAEAAFRQSNELLKGLIEEFPENVTYRKSAMGLCTNWTSYSVKMGRFEAAMETALMMKRLAESDPRGEKNAEVRQHLSTSLELIGGTLGMQAATRRESLAAYEKQLELIKALMTDFPDRPDHKVSYLICQYNLANNLNALTEFERSEHVAGTASKLGEGWLAEQPKNFQLQLFTARLQLTSAHIALLKGEYQDSMRFFQLCKPFYEPMMDSKEGDIDIISQANNWRAYQALAMYNIGDIQQGSDGMLATYARMRNALEGQSDFTEARRLLTFCAANYILMKIRSGERQVALDFANRISDDLPSVDPWTAKLLLGAAQASLGKTEEAMQVLRETKGEEIQSTMWPDRVTVVVAALCYQALQKDQTMAAEERDRLVSECLQVASHELDNAQQSGFFLAPMQREYLFKYPEVVSLLDEVDFRLVLP